jgi:2-iminobutanoate/2-iminopropanoate deaminase
MFGRFFSAVRRPIAGARAASATPEFTDAGSPLPAGLPFSAAVRHGDVLYLSGQLGVLPGTRALSVGGVRGEARQAILNVESVLTAHGLSLSDVIRCTVMLADIEDWAAFNEVWGAMFRPPYPARSAFATQGLALGARVEIECTAALRPAPR